MHLRHYLNRFLVPVALIATSCPVSARPDDARGTAVTALLAPWSKAEGPGVQVSVSLDGNTVYQTAAGMADLEQRVTLTRDSVFHAASLSKQVTAFALLLLEQDKQLSIDDPLSRHLPEAAALGPITLRQMLTHTSGMRELGTLSAMAGWRPEDILTQRQAVALLLRQKGLNAAPGTRFEYINSDYVLLAEVIQRRSGKSLAEFCRERIFAPLGMAHTRFQEDVTTPMPGRVPSWRPSQDGYRRAVLNYAYVGATGLQTTSADLQRWAINLNTGTLGGLGLPHRMEQRGILADRSMIDYALGQDLRHWHGFDVWMHGGRDAGFRSFLLRVPSERLTVSVLGNAADFNSTEIAFAIADIYLRDRRGYRAEPAPSTETPTAAQLATYAGTFELFPGLLLTLSTDGKQLLIASRGGTPQPLPALDSRRFVLDPKANLTLEMPPAINGRSPSFTYRIGRDGAIVARRVALAAFDSASVDPMAYVGRYWSEELATAYDLLVENGHLVARHPRNGDVELTAYQRDTFAGPESHFPRVQFKRDPKGQVISFLLSGPLAEGISFVRM